MTFFLSCDQKELSFICIRLFSCLRLRRLKASSSERLIISTRFSRDHFFSWISDKKKTASKLKSSQRRSSRHNARRSSRDHVYRSLRKKNKQTNCSSSLVVEKASKFLFVLCCLPNCSSSNSSLDLQRSSPWRSLWADASSWAPPVHSQEQVRYGLFATPTRPLQRHRGFETFVSILADVYLANATSTLHANITHLLLFCGTTPRERLCSFQPPAPNRRGVTQPRGSTTPNLAGDASCLRRRSVSEKRRLYERLFLIHRPFKQSISQRIYSSIEAMA